MDKCVLRLLGSEDKRVEEILVSIFDVRRAAARLTGLKLQHNGSLLMIEAPSRLHLPAQY